jgi:hypothetical protein
MYEITVKGEAKTAYPNLRELDGVDCQDCFSEYFDETTWSEDVTGGYLRFKYEDGKLWSITEYDSSRLLSQDELFDLQEYTQGQWSDGIGEGFEQQPCFEADEWIDPDLGEDDPQTEVYISPWFYNQQITIFQTEQKQKL